MSRRVIVIGGGTIQPIRNHLALCAPAFGTTAKAIHKLMGGSELVLTKMANDESMIRTNEDLATYINRLTDDKTVGTIILNAAFCDFKPLPINDIECGFYADRLKTSDGNIKLELTPTEKVISKIREKRPDIFLVGFKTTTNKTAEEQFLIGLKMMKQAKCNLVLANDTVTYNNLIITPEETMYCETTNRSVALVELCDMIKMRHNLTYHKGKFSPNALTVNIPFSEAPESFQIIIKYLIENGGFIMNNGNGFTPGHFCYRNNNTERGDENCFISSQRKVNHNEVLGNGMTFVKVYNDEFTYIGTKKPSVGARSQYMMLKENPEFIGIIHTHNPLKDGSEVPTTPQKPYQCGSLECGLNTVNHLKSFNNGLIKAVYLEKHGINLIYHKNCPTEDVIKFIKDHIELGIKTK